MDVTVHSVIHCRNNMKYECHWTQSCALTGVVLVCTQTFSSWKTCTEICLWQVSSNLQGSAKNFCIAAVESINNVLGPNSIFKLWREWCQLWPWHHIIWRRLSSFLGNAGNQLWKYRTSQARRWHSILSLLISNAALQSILYFSCLLYCDA
jgi:hypothetical protein